MKRKKWISILLIIAAVLLLFVACSEKKAIPVPENLAVENNVLTWDAVSGATSYDVKVDDNVYVANENKYTLSISDYETHEISVRANTYDGTGEYSDVYYYKRRQTKSTLPQLSAPRISMTGNRVLWNTILNNDGYIIYFDGKTIDVAKNSTFYDLTFTRDGRFDVTMQTKGDGITYATSKMSSPYQVTVTDLQGRYQSLPKVEFTFNAAEKVIEWKNRYTAEAVSYEIYRDDDPNPVATLPADSNSTRQTHVPMLSGGEVHYSMRLISMDGLYNASDFNDGITFPIADKAPDGLAVLPDDESGKYAIRWSARDYSDGYVVEIDGVETPVTATAWKVVPTTLSAGRHVARVRTSGNGVYYTNSLYSCGMVFYTEEGGAITTRLETPAAPQAVFAEGELRIIADPVEHAVGYRLCLVTPTRGTFYLTIDQAGSVLTESKIGSRIATAEESNVVSTLLASKASGVRVSIAALAEGALYEDSLYSEEVMAAVGEVEYVGAVVSFRYDVRGFSWVTDKDAATIYELMLDGEIHELVASDKLSVSEGEHTARIRRKADNSLWSEEIAFRAPVDVEPPTALSVTSGVLSFTPSDGARGYLLYANGELVATLGSSENMVLLSSHLRVDGKYLLHMQAIASSGGPSSAPSEEIVYVKTDGAYGTETKPYAPTSALELLSLMRDNSIAYFKLAAGETYDLTSYDFSASSFDFGGVLIGNNATLKLSTKYSVFSSLNGAGISGLNIVIDASNFTTARGGVLAAQARSSEFTDVKIKVTGSSAFSGSASFGVLFSSTDGLTLRRVEVDCDYSLNCGEACAFAPIAYDFKGNVVDLVLKGTSTIRGTTARYAGIGVLGSMTVTGFDASQTINVTGSLSATVTGVTLDGTSTVTEMNGANVVTMNAPISTYYGAATADVSIADSVIGGRVEMGRGRSAGLYGVAESRISRMKNVTVSSMMKATATEGIRAAGFASVLDEAETAGSAFTGLIELVAEGADVTAAGCAIDLSGGHTLRFAGTIKQTGGRAEHALGAINTSGASSFLLAGKSVLREVTSATAVGAGVNINGDVTVSGSWEIDAEGCGETSIGGVSAGTNRNLTVTDYTLCGSIQATGARVAGVSFDDSFRPRLAALDLTVDLRLTSDDIQGAGVVLGANTLPIPSNASLSISIAGVGAGDIAGLALDVTGVDLADIDIAGALSLVGEGNIYGIATEAGRVSGIASTMSLYAEGDVKVYGMFDRVSSASGLSCGGSVTILSDNAEYYGVVRGVNPAQEGQPISFKDITLSDLTFHAVPMGSGESALTVCGVIGEAGRIKDVTVTGAVTYDIGAFDDLSFGGVAYSLGDSAENLAVNYVLNSDAKNAEIGGAFIVGGGTLTSVRLGGTSPLTVRASGNATIGGLFAESNTLAVVKGSTYLKVTAEPTATESVKVGGAISRLQDNNTLTFSDHALDVTILRKGVGSSLLGGVAAEMNGILEGAKVNVNISSESADDVIGGVAATSANALMRLRSSLVKGTINAPSLIGGLFGDCSGGVVEKVATTLSIVNGQSAGGLFGRARSVSVTSAYSLARFTSGGYGLFKEGDGVSIDFGYFAGTARTAALAGSATDCSATSFYVDIADSDVPLVASGSLKYYTGLPSEPSVVLTTSDAPLLSAGLEKGIYRSFAYGYAGSDLGGDFVTDGVRYPYLSSLGYPLAAVSASPIERAKVDIDVQTTLYDGLSLPRYYGASSLTLSWVDEGGNLDIARDAVTVIDNGSGTLCGYVTGGVSVYRVPYLSTGFEPFTGTGTELDPYLISNIKYFPHIVEYDGVGVYFKVALASDQVQGATLSASFSEEAPFRGNIDFGGVNFLSPTIGESGIFGYMTGAKVSNLTLSELTFSGVILAQIAQSSTIENTSLSGVLDGVGTFIGVATDSDITSLTARFSGIRDCAFTLLSSVSGGTLSDLSVRIDLETGEDVTLYVLGESSGVTVSGAQVIFNVRVGGLVKTAFVREDTASAFTSLFVLTDAVNVDGDSEIAGFAFSAEGSTFNNGVVLISGMGDIYPLIKEGTAIYDGVKVCTVASLAATPGVTALAPNEVKAALLLMTGYVDDGALCTPLGFSRFVSEEETPDYSFSVNSDEIELTAALVLADAFYYECTEPLARFVAFAYVGSGATIVDGALRPTAATGSGTLTLTNVYGEMVDISVTVLFDGFTAGDGSEEHPYEIASFEELKKLDSYDGGSYYYVLTSDITSGDGSLEVPLAFNGVLDGDGHTVTVDLAADSLFAESYGIIRGVNFVITKSSAEDALFMSSAGNLTLDTCIITVHCAEYAFSKSGNYGLLFNSIEGCTLTSVTVNVGTASVSAVGGQVGVIAGLAENTVVRALSVTGNVTVTSTEELFFGAFGKINSYESTYRVYPDIENYPDDYVDYPYVQSMTLAVTYSLTGGDLTVGGAAGESNVNLEAVVGTVVITVTGDALTVGGAVGSLMGELYRSDIEGSLVAQGADCAVGGLVGKQIGALGDSSADVSVDVTSTGTAYAGGAVGYGYYSIEKVTTVADIRAHSSADGEAIAALLASEDSYPTLVAAGGVVGYCISVVADCTVTLTEVSATTDHTDRLYVFAGGVAGYATAAQDNVTSGEEDITATGGNAMTGALVALLDEKD